MSTRSIEADKPFDYTPFDLTQGLRQGSSPLLVRVAAVPRLRLVTRASHAISSKTANISLADSEATEQVE